MFQCRLRNGPRLWIRPFSSDWETAYEVFRLRTYDTGMAEEAVRRVVDVGGNVGYSCLFWCAMYPNARVLTYEPHPIHCELLQQHMEANGYSGRVRLIPAGAAAKASTAALSDNGNQSALVAQDSMNAGPVIEIATVDFFETVGSQPIDILKIDIEGGEYDILQDSRFDDVAERCGCIVMEWHKRAPHHLGGRWCEERLRALGFCVRDVPAPSPTQDIGTILTFRNS
jgi:FkbM family methyltransferase